MWRKILTQNIVSSARFVPGTFVACGRLFSSEVAAVQAIEQNHHKETKVRPHLVSSAPSFHALDKELREKYQGKHKEYEDVVEVRNRASTFTAKDWHDYLCAFSALGIQGGGLHFASNKLSTMTHIIAQMTKCCELFEPIDYFNFIRLLLRFEFSFSSWRQLPIEVQENVCSWFLKNFEQLERSAFFEILLVKTQWLEKNELLLIEKPEDVLRVLEHGTILATNSSEIHTCLTMLHLCEVYSKVFKGSNWNPPTDKLLESLSTRVWPNSLGDLSGSLRFVTGQLRQLAKTSRLTNTTDVFRHFAKESPTAWGWLRNSIELIFEDDKYDDLRQLAALAAVDAHIYGAVKFTVDELARILSKASEPYMKNPAIVLQPMRTDMPSLTRSQALKVLLGAICKAILEEPCLRSRIVGSVRFDNDYWDRFFAMLEAEVPKLEGNNTLMLESLWGLNKALWVDEHRRLLSRDKMIINFPLDRQRRRYILRKLNAPGRYLPDST